MAKKLSRKSRPDANGSATKPTKAIEAKPTPEGRLWFDEQGHLNQSGPVPLSRYLGGLSDQLRLFLARLDSCERTDAGDYLLRDARAGNLGGMRVLWDNVVLLAQASIAKTLPGMTPDQHAAMTRDGVLATVTAPTRNAQPLADALRQLLFSILYNADGSWVSEISSATVAKIRTIGDELTQHRTAWERSEGGPTRTPTVSPELLDRLQRAAAAMDPGAIDRAAERAAEKMARVFDGDAKSASNGHRRKLAKDDGQFRPATWFPKGMADRLRQAASKKRKTKRVATRTIDGVVCYSVADARRWWPSDVPKEA
ncbi:MAG: hypothetical protein WAZ94_08825 [Phycisphaerales bacterium]